MKIQEVIDVLETFAPLPYAEGFDNVGLLTGSADTELEGILITLDTLENVVEEAVKKGCNMIVSFHPIIFTGLKRLTGASYIERAVIRAVQNNIAIYAIHTALDNHYQGVNDMICQKLGLYNRKILVPQPGTILKLISYVPKSEAEQVRKSLFKAGAGNIGNYDQCSFNLEGTGTFRGNENSQPVKGQKGELHYEEEIQVGVILPKHLKSAVLKALFKSHPYEEVAYEVYALENENQQIGMGMTGELKEPMDEQDFLSLVKRIFDVPVIRHSRFLEKRIHKVAVLGGSGSFAISRAKAARADIFITADLKYHDFFQAEGKLVLADIGHYESEQYTKNLLASFLNKKIPNFAVVLSETDTNPIKYF